jgi:cell division protein FtsA
MRVELHVARCAKAEGVGVAFGELVVGEPVRCGGVVLTGGTSRLAGIEDLATRVFGVTARRGENPPNLADELREPEFSTVLGLLFYGLNQASDRLPGVQRRRHNVLTRFAKLFATA